MSEYYGQPSQWELRKDGKAICRRCKQPRNPQGHDPCIANLPGVLFACCGHGRGEAYVAFREGHVLRGRFDHDPRTKVPCPDWNHSEPPPSRRNPKSTRKP